METHGEDWSGERIEIRDFGHFMELRRPLITASNIGIVCGEGGYASAAMYYAEKVGLRPEQADNAVLQRGRWGEASAFEAAAEMMPDRSFVRSRVFFRNQELGLGATPDGFENAVGRPGFGVVQTKVMARGRFRKLFLVDPDSGINDDAEPPMPFVLQTLCEAMLAGADRGLLVILVVGEYTWDFRAFEIERNPVLEELIVRKVREFWDNYLIPRVMPPVDFERDLEIVKLLYPKGELTEIDLSTDNRALALAEDLREMQAAAKRLETNISKVKLELCMKLGQHTYGRLADGRRLSWKHQTRKAHTVKASEYRAFKILEP